MNAWYDKVAGNMPAGNPMMPGNGASGIGPRFMNPVQRYQYIMQALTNPAQFIRNMFPDIPNEIANDPNRVGNYLMQTRGNPTQEMVNYATQQGYQLPGYLKR